jgi:hypothetical protein
VGLDLTESYAMTPAASVSGIYLAHPDARYFSVGRIGHDQLEDYASRKGIEKSEAQQWLRPNLADTGADAAGGRRAGGPDGGSEEVPSISSAR